jgi:serine/threonine protein phosphatase PrpC
VWAGDSRIYLYRRGQLFQLSRDHTEVQELLDRGAISPEEARTWPRRNVITRAIGVWEDLSLEMAHGQIQPDDKFLICSDGLIAHVSDDEIRDMLEGNPPEETCRSLIALTLARGGSDNVTVVVIHFRMSPSVVKAHDWAASSSYENVV